MQPRDPMTNSQKLRFLFDAVVQDKMQQSQNAPGSRNTVGPRGADEESGEVVEQGVYIISVAARILAMHPQTLRKYERVGLVRPSRTVGMLRLYSEEDIAKLRMIKHLVDDLRLNLAGVEMALAVFDRLIEARIEMASRSSGPAHAVFERTVQDILALLQGRHPEFRGERA
ncbi:MAG: MerR family transcriptional regulator [Dehalococcoidia bacterium]